MRQSVLVLSMFAISACAVNQAPATPANRVTFSDKMDVEKFALRVSPIEAEYPGTYRVIWHPWHQNIAALSVVGTDDRYELSVAQTDGYGTYRIGEFRSQKERRITRAEYQNVAIAFEAIKTIDQQIDIFGAAPDGEIMVCLHSSSYMIEARIADEANSIYRHCNSDYARDFKIAQPLVDLAWEKFPKQMEHIDPIYLSEQMLKEEQEQSQE